MLLSDLKNWPQANITLQVFREGADVSTCFQVGLFSEASRKLSVQVSTAEDNGILLYNGDNDHIAVELYQGHVKVSYDPGSQPGHAIYRYGAHLLV